jgi:hypothetical protein
MFCGVLLGLAALGAPTLFWFRSTALGAETARGLLKVVSEPGAASVFIDGKASGVTPVSLTLHPGVHRLALRQGDRVQEISVVIAENVSTVHHFTWPVAAPNVPSTGSLRVVTDGAPGAVTVDSRQRGSTPTVVTDLTAGDHDVIVVRSGTTYRRTIRVEPGAMASLVVGATASAGPQSGWLSASAAIPLDIREAGQLVGSTASERILMPAGDHALEFENPALGFRAARQVNILAGRTQDVGIELPPASISINATPWAQVWLDGQPLGETPIGNVTTSIGSHEVVFRHPQLGERRLTAVVKASEPARVGVDMRSSQ